MFIDVLFLSEITLRIRNWQTSNFKFGFCNYTSFFVVMLRTEQLFPNLLKKWKLSVVKLISKRM